MTEGERKSLQQSIRDTWLGALGVLSDAEAELSRTAQRVLESVGLREGEGAQALGEPGRESLRETARELVDRVRRNREALERRVDEGVRMAVARVHRPLALELANLRERVEQAQRRLEALAPRRRTVRDRDAGGEARREQA